MLAIEGWDDKNRGSRPNGKMLAIENGYRSENANALAIEDRSWAPENANPLAIEDQSRASAYASRRSGHSNAIILAKPEDNDSSTFGVTRYSRSAKTFGTKSRQGRDPTMYIPGQEDKPDPEHSQILRITEGRDPTMYIPGIDDKPDPHFEGVWFSDNDMSRGEYEDTFSKPRREPTMYVDGLRHDEEPSLRVMRDPTMYIGDMDRWDNGASRSSSLIPYATEVENGVQGVDYDTSNNKSSASNVSYYEKDKSESHRESSVAGTKASKRSKKSKTSKYSKSSYGSG
ncbi:hypothetical protein ACHAXA_007090 [Cyclostephanos tholiformis]|uniref:Uncharacterized protein n=1 Tax=Cyclostephanos tholiformis TaxID=382380 RepID=A0ABD3RZ49_9STRA